jgi:F-type H+-transporting ATPase subunit a
LSIFWIILIFNLFGMFPYSFPITAHIIITFFFSLMVWILSIWLACDLHGLNFYKLFVPNAILIMQFFLIILEIISFIIQFCSLCFTLLIKQNYFISIKSINYEHNKLSHLTNVS